MLLEQVGIVVDWNKKSGGYMEGKSRPAAHLMPGNQARTASKHTLILNERELKQKV